MNIPTFFRFLKYKINMYDKMASNPFVEPKKRLIIVWVESNEESTHDNFYDLN